MTNSNQIEKKILGYFNGQLSPKEEQELLTWIRTSEENRKYFLKLKEKFGPESIQNPIAYQSFLELKNRIFIANQQLPQDRKVKRLNYSFTKIAAILMIGLFLGFVSSYILGKIYNLNEQVVWFETKVPRGEKSMLNLPDGSKIWVNAESAISYPSNFLDDNRIVKLVGEAYFEVAKQKGQGFIVRTDDYDVHVLGTKFNVTAYKDLGKTETSLIEGKIEIEKGNDVLQVVPGEVITYKNNLFQKKKSNTVSMSKWKDNVFDFDQITLSELVVRLERWYNVEIDIKDQQLKSIVFSGIFKNEETIDEVLNTFQFTMPISYSRDGFRKFSINRKN
ncbi:MAG: FecR family protein [Mangrovibacterium sp.]